jgi:hypothetical protein
LLNTFLENSKQLTARKVAAVVGKVIALSPALGNIGQNNDQTFTSCYTDLWFPYTFFIVW